MGKHSHRGIETFRLRRLRDAESRRERETIKQVIAAREAETRASVKSQGGDK
jgi:hypothetical protein